MASVSVSTLIIFIAAVTVAAGVSGMLVGTVSDISQSMETQGESMQESLETDIQVISDPESSVTDGTDTVVLVKNTGSRTLPSSPDALDIVYNGEFVPSSDTTTTLPDDDTWKQGAVLRVAVDRLPTTGEENRVVVIVNQQEEVFRFYAE
jgi:flagellar protein FlaG